MSVLPASQNQRRAVVRFAMAALLVGYVGFVAAAQIWDVSVHSASTGFIVAFCVLAAMEFSVFDEIAKRSHYIAWYWGGALGLVAVAIVHVLLATGWQPVATLTDAVVARLGDGGPRAAFLAGTMATPLLMALGFCIVRGVDWLRSR